MAKWPGLPERLREALKAAGYWKNDRADVLRFSMSNGFLPTYTYKYLQGTTVPDRENLFKLAEALGVTPAWLLFGDEKPTKKVKKRLHPIAGGSGDVGPDQAGAVADVLPLIRHWLRRLSWLCGPGTPSWCPA